MDSRILDPKTFSGSSLYPDCVHVSQIRDYIHGKTGVLVSERQITDWVECGDLPCIEVPPQSSNHKWWTRAAFIDKTIDKHIRGEIVGGWRTPVYPSVSLVPPVSRVSEGKEAGVATAGRP